jgi:hypothetical protein
MSVSVHILLNSLSAELTNLWCRYWLNSVSLGGGAGVLNNILCSAQRRESNGKILNLRGGLPYPCDEVTPGILGIPITWLKRVCPAAVSHLSESQSYDLEWLPLVESRTLCYTSIYHFTICSSLYKQYTACSANMSPEILCKKPEALSQEFRASHHTILQFAVLDDFHKPDSHRQLTFPLMYSSSDVWQTSGLSKRDSVRIF